MKILLTGANGQLGRCFQDRLPKDWTLLATDTENLDITELDGVMKLVNAFMPQVIVNAAAYTAVDKAETDRTLATKVNALGPKNLATAAKSIGASFFHVSTDYVFDGSSAVPYVETDKTMPLGVYGETKLAGEQNAMAVYAEKTTILRTAWVFSEYGNNFIKTMLRLAKERDELKVVNDQIGCPTYAGDLAAAIITLIMTESQAGLYHYCGNASMSWCQFAEQIINVGYDLGKVPVKPKITGIPTRDYPTPAKRPAFSMLSTDKICTMGVPFSDLATNLVRVVNKME